MRCSAVVDDMKKKEKFEPVDSNHQPAEDDQTVRRREDQKYTRKEPKITAPALKRKFSEQPPTKHNAKT